MGFIMNMVDIEKLEEKVDNYLYNILDESIPRNKYIYHCNLVFIDFVIDQKLQFTISERDFLFSLTYNTYLAHLKLKEEKEFDYQFDKALYAYAYEMIIKGMHYSLLCNAFPLVHSGLAEIIKTKENSFSFNFKDIPRRNYKYLSDYTIRKYLSYSLQMAAGKLSNIDDEDAAFKLSQIYMDFWNENMLYGDFEPYTRLDFVGVCFFFILAAMRRFVKLYKNDFDIIKTDSQNMMIILSPKRSHELKEYSPRCTEEIFQIALDDNTYKPIGRGLYPKLSVADASLHKTIDGYIFVNPLVILFNESYETKLLNYLRKADNKRYLRIKDKIKERVIPIITEMIACKFPATKVIPNFNIGIPEREKDQRECDLLIVDNEGNALYIEIKHFYYPLSVSETKNLDEQLSLALEKMPDQLLAIERKWEELKSKYKIEEDLKSLKGIISSHHYTGYNVRIDSSVPIVNTNTLYESIAESKTILDIYPGCKEIDSLYPNLKFIKREINIPFAGINFSTQLECLDPFFETLFILDMRKQVSSNLVIGTRPRFHTTSDVAKAYLEGMAKK